MRLSHDRDSWHAQSVERRDFRHQHDGPEVPPHRSARKPKGCRRKAGRAHVPVKVTGRYYDRIVCDVCGKVLRYCWHPYGRPTDLPRCEDT